MKKVLKTLLEYFPQILIFIIFAGFIIRDKADFALVSIAVLIFSFYIGFIINQKISVLLFYLVNKNKKRKRVIFKKLN